MRHGVVGKAGDPGLAGQRAQHHSVGWRVTTTGPHCCAPAAATGSSDTTAGPRSGANEPRGPCRSEVA